mmetsp:Transcript_540/g.1265  ORF Transcript_540/g.1265 Transcript_540/m.1265 type:complete len:250 (+) Transcript_540:158-907(+)
MRGQRRLWRSHPHAPHRRRAPRPPAPHLPYKVNLPLGEPHLWFPSARRLRRRVICHIGPTNSGKTFAALQALKAAPTGIYCGPLRLLAWEVSNSLRQPTPTIQSQAPAAYQTDAGASIPCDLVTGQERDLQPGAQHLSCTVEMCPLDRAFACAVLDEAQLLGDPRRGWAWTQAFLGLQAEELHLCGSPSFLPLVRGLCEKTQDLLEVRRWPRLSPLGVGSRSLDSYRVDEAVHLLSSRMAIAVSAEFPN